VSEPTAPPSGSNFVRDIILADDAAGTYGGRVVTRFPPEPNGYLHIGHAKAICVNFGIAREFDGVCHLRFDDTNPVTEDTEFVEGIKADIRWLGFDWGDKLFFASDFFAQMYALAEGLVLSGDAYVCMQTEEAFKTFRGSVTEPGTAPPGRERSIEDNLVLFRRMKAGDFADGHCVLRARIDMSSPNMKLRDPPLYRIKKATHHRTGDDWCIYPMYDFAHPLEDALEHVTHSLCTLEFDNNRALYDWVIEHTAVTSRPRQYEFARLAIQTIVTSKRKLKRLVDEGLVNGWDDPRMPTLRGLKRRGVPPAAIRSFCEGVGLAKVNSTVELPTFHHAIRDALNHEAPRVMAVLDPLELVIDNFPEGQVDWLEASHWPHDVPREGTRKIPFSRRLYIERSDFQEVPSKGFRRMSPGTEIRLRYGFIVECTGVDKDPDTGAIVRVHATHDPLTRGGNAPDGRKISSTIHWVSATESLPCTVRLIGSLFSVDNPDAGGQDYVDIMNPESMVVCEGARIEPSMADVEPEVPYQFERSGYFVRDNQLEGLVFNRAVSLKDGWSKTKKKQAPEPTVAPASAPKSDDDRRARKRRGRSEVLAELHAADPELAERMERYTTTLGLSESDAQTLTSDRRLSDFFESARSHHADAQAIAKWVINAVQAAAKESGIEGLRFSGADIAGLVGLLEDGTISSKGAKKVFAVLQSEGGLPSEIVERLGLAQLNDPDKIRALVDQALADNPGQLGQYRGGNTRLFGFFVGAVLRASGGAANPDTVNHLLREALDS
jgi:glutaminyl-tRNA synthetase